jgi:hypothetical protein
VFVAYGEAMMLDGSCDSLRAHLCIIDGEVRARASRAGTVLRNDRTGTVAVDAFSAEPNRQCDHRGATHNMMVIFVVSAEELARLRHSAAARVEWQRQHTGEAVKYIHLVAWVPHGEGPVLPIAAEVSTHGSVSAEHLADWGFFGRTCRNLAIVVDEWNEFHPPDEHFRWVFIGGDGAYPLVLKEPVVVARDPGNWNFDPSATLLDQPWREMICGSHLSDTTGQALWMSIDSKHHLKGMRYHLVKPGWQLAAWVDRSGRVVTFDVDSLREYGVTEPVLNNDPRTKQDEGSPATLRAKSRNLQKGRGPIATAASGRAARGASGFRLRGRRIGPALTPCRKGVREWRCLSGGAKPSQTPKLPLREAALIVLLCDGVGRCQGHCTVAAASQA